MDREKSPDIRAFRPNQECRQRLSRRNYNCQCERELGVKLRDAEASIDTEMGAKTFMPLRLLILLLFVTPVHSRFTYMYSQYVCVCILYICLHIFMITGYTISPNLGFRSV